MDLNQNDELTLLVIDFAFQMVSVVITVIASLLPGLLTAVLNGFLGLLGVSGSTV